MLGDELRKLREKQGISQTTLSKMTGIPQTSISDLERNVYIPKADICLILSEALNVDVRVWNCQ